MSKANILYVDDEVSNLRTFKNSLRREYNVLTATSGEEGLKILAKNEIDVIVADQKMPEMTGVDFLKIVLKKYPMPNRILITGYTNFDALKDAINEGKIFQYVQKPWEKEILVHILEKAIEAYHLEKDNKQLKEKLLKNNKEISSINKKLKKEIDVKNTALKKLKQSESELKINEIRLKEAQMIANTGNWEIDHQTNTMYWSEGFFQIMGMNSKKVKPTFQMFSDIIYKEDKEKDYKAYSDHLKNKQPYEIELRMQLNDETIKYISKRCRTKFNAKGKAVQSIGTIQDITDKKLFEFELRVYQEELENLIKIRTKELKEERDRAQNYLDIANVIFLIRDQNQNIKLINKKGLEILGYSSEKELLDVNWYDNFVAQKDRNLCRKTFIDYINEKIPLKPDYECTLITKKGEGRIILWKDTLLRDNDGQVVGVLSSGDDITLRKRNESMLKDYTNELEMFNKSMLGREMRIIELKEEINSLAKDAGKKIPYPEIWEK